MTQLQPQSKMLKNYTKQDFNQWKNDGFSKIFFDFLQKKAEDIKQLTLDDFVTWTPMDDKKRKIYENRQAFFRCILEILETDFDSIDEYYKGLEEGENDKI